MNIYRFSKFVQKSLLRVPQRSFASLSSAAPKISISELKIKGFTIINLPSIAPTLASATSAFTKLNQFRYPCDNYDKIINEKYQAAFNSMYFLTAACLHQVCSEFPLPPPTTAPFDKSNKSPFCGSQTSNCQPYKHSSSPQPPTQYNCAPALQFNQPVGTLGRVPSLPMPPPQLQCTAPQHQLSSPSPPVCARIRCTNPNTIAEATLIPDTKHRSPLRHEATTGECVIVSE